MTAILPKKSFSECKKYALKIMLLLLLLCLLKTLFE